MCSMTYDEIVTLLLGERTQLEKSNRKEWSRAAVAAKLGVSGQVFYYWETQRNRAPTEQLKRWAGLFGYRLVSEIVPINTGPTVNELKHALGFLNPKDQARVLRYARLLRQVAGTRDYVTLTNIVDAAENSLAKPEASRNPA